MIKPFCFIVIATVALLVEVSLAANGYSNPVFVRSTPNALRHSINGPGFPRNHIYDPFIFVGSDVGRTIARVNLNTGEITTQVPFPLGEADDIDFNNQGVGIFSSLFAGTVNSFRTNGQPPIQIGQVDPVGPNGVGFLLYPNGTSRAFFSQDPVGSGLYEVDPSGVRPQQLITTLTSGLNGFDFGPDGKIYGALNFEGRLVKIDIVTKVVTTVSSGFIDIEGVRWNENKTALYAVDDGVNTIYRIDPTTGAKTPIVSVPEPAYIDNFRIYHDSIVMSEQIHNAVIQYNMTTGVSRSVTPFTPFCIPQGISFVGDTLYIADYTNLKRYYVPGNDITVYARSGPQPSPDPNVSYGIFNIYANRDLTALACNFDGRVQIRTTANNAVVTQVPAGWPYGLALADNNTRLIVADFGTALTVWSGPNYQSNVSFANFPSTGFTGIALDSVSPFVFVAEYFTGQIYRVNYLTGAFTTPVTGLSSPEGISFRVEGGVKFLYVAEVGTKTLTKVNLSTGVKVAIATQLPIGLDGPATLPPPFAFTGVSVYGNGDVYVSSDLNDTIVKIAAGAVTPQQYCAAQSFPSGTIGYFCNSDNSGYYACLSGAFASQSSQMNCPAGTTCHCASGIECSNGGTQSPCQ